MLTDLGLAWRRLRRAPGFTAIAVLTVALAIGANAAILSVADAVLFRPLGYGDAERLRIVQMRDPVTDRRYYRIPPAYLDGIERFHHGVGEVAHLESGSLIESTAEGAVGVTTAAVSAGYFGVLRVPAHRGRLFDATDVGAGRPALLSYGTWQERFGGDEGVVGGVASLGGETWDVIGVLPPGFTFPSTLAGSPDLVTLLPPRAADEGAFEPIVRLEPGVTAAQAQAELDAIVAGIVVDDADVGRTVPVLTEVRAVLYATGRPIMLFLLAAASLVLLIACANLANLYLAAARQRERETGVAGALGASRLRLIRPVVFESCLIALLGAALALALAAFGFDFLIRLVPAAAYGAAHVGVDARVAAFALGLGILVGLLTAVWPAWRIAHVAPHVVIAQATRSGGRRRLRFGRPMIAVQVALAVVVVFGAAIATRAFIDALRIPLGFTHGGVALIDVRAPGQDGTARQAFYERVLALLADDADVASVGATGSVPVVRGVPWGAARRGPGQPNAASVVHVLPGYFETADIPLVVGRMLTWRDGRERGASAVVSESAARALVPDGDAVGATFVDDAARTWTIAGVVRDARMQLAAEAAPLPSVYVLPGDDTRTLTVLVRPHVRSGAVLERMRRDVARLAPGSIVRAQWWSDAIAALTPYRNPRFQTVVLATFALLALGVTALGVGGVIAFTLALRRRELGIRLALGVAPNGLVRMLLRYALTPVAAGLAAGLLATRALARLAEAQLFDVDTRDPLTLVATIATVLSATAVAAYLPARSATRLDPMITLKQD